MSYAPSRPQQGVLGGGRVGDSRLQNEAQVAKRPRRAVENTIKQHLLDLQLNNAKFEILFNDDNNIAFNKDGIDSVDFLVSFNTLLIMILVKIRLIKKIQIKMEYSKNF